MVCCSPTREGGRRVGTALATDFPTRAEAIADTVAEEEPDLLGLQEVTDWAATPTHAGPTPPSQDFLAILTAALAERGLHYEVAAVAHNADIGPAPLVAPQFGCGLTATDCLVSLRDRDVILVNADTPALHWSDPGRAGSRRSRPSPRRPASRSSSPGAGRASR